MSRNATRSSATRVLKLPELFKALRATFDGVFPCSRSEHLKDGVASTPLIVARSAWEYGRRGRITYGQRQPSGEAAGRADSARADRSAAPRRQGRAHRQR